MGFIPPEQRAQPPPCFSVHHLVVLCFFVLLCGPLRCLLWFFAVLCGVCYGPLRSFVGFVMVLCDPLRGLLWSFAVLCGVCYGPLWSFVVLCGFVMVLCGPLRGLLWSFAVLCGVCYGPLVLCGPLWYLVRPSVNSFAENIVEIVECNTPYRSVKWGAHLPSLSRSACRWIPGIWQIVWCLGWCKAKPTVTFPVYATVSWLRVGGWVSQVVGYILRLVVYGRPK